MKIKILFLVTLAFILRFYNLDWDLGNFFHPDERNIANSVSKISFFSQLNPGFFAYGGFFIYLIRAVSEAVAFITSDHSWIYDWGRINLIGRHIGALFSTLTVIPVFFLAKRLYDEKTALISSFLYVFTVGSIQIAHFAITENLITFFAVLITYLSIKIYEKQKIITVLALGFIMGASVATKISALSFIIAPLITFTFIFLKKIKSTKFLKLLIIFILFWISAIATFLLFSPYTILSFDKFLESMRYESGVALGTLPVPYTRQFENTIPYLFHLYNLFWQQGLSLVFSLLGACFILYQIIRRKNIAFFIFLSFPLIYFIYVGSWYTKFIRFMYPIVPFLIILAAYALVKIEKRNKKIGRLIVLTIVAGTFLWAIAFTTIYARPQTRIEASNWIYKNIPAGSKILTEHWDDGLPIPLPAGTPSIYNIRQLKIYDDENGFKSNYYASNLSNAGYVVINSRRLYGTLINLPSEYPTTSRYYKLLFNGNLGYEKMIEFSSYPEIAGFEINDDATEETFQVYDHPKVIIFKNKKRFSQVELFNILEEKKL